MELYDSALISSMFVSIVVFSISSSSSVSVSNFWILAMLNLSRRFSSSENLDEISVIWSDKGWIYVSFILSLSRQY